jgi:hypothetical protein
MIQAQALAYRHRHIPRLQRSDEVEASVGSIFGAWTMVLVAAAVLAAVAIGLPLAIFKTFELFEVVAGKSRERARVKLDFFRIRLGAREATRRSRSASSTRK